MSLTPKLKSQNHLQLHISHPAWPPLPFLREQLMSNQLLGGKTKKQPGTSLIAHHSFIF